MTLTELKTYIKNTVHSEETSFVAMLDTLIQNAEKRIHNRVVMPDAKATVLIDDGETIADQQDYVLTANILAPLRVYMTSWGPLQRKPLALIRELSTGSAVDVPIYYGWVNSTATTATIAVWPIPNANYRIYMDYLKGVPPSLVEAATWLSTNYPDVLRKTAVYEASIYLKQGEMGTQYGAEAEKEIAALAQIVGAPQRDEYA